MKKKLILGIVAATLSLSLAVGGTLMLFAATTNSAVNTVTIGKGFGNDPEHPTNEHFVLRETADDGATYDYDGINYGTVAPGAALAKEPSIIRLDGAPAYLRVRADLQVKVGPTTYSAANNNLNALLTLAGTNGQLFIDYVRVIFASASQTPATIIDTTTNRGGTLNENWAFVEDSGTSALGGTFYYTGNGSYPTPFVADTTGTSVSKDDSTYYATPVLFDELVVPDWEYYDSVYDLFADWEINLVLLGGAVQSDNNTLATTDIANTTAWAALFADLDK
jgi:hypothetical protein